jgi:drug/metabolite transporter (DMT)-like permease
MLAIVLALGSSLAYGASDFLGGLKTRSVALTRVLVVVQTTSLLTLVVVGALLGLWTDPPDARYLAFGALAGLWQLGGVAALYRGLATGTMGVVAPIAATSPVFAVIAGIAIGEVPAPLQWLGIACAVAGVALATLGSQPGVASGARTAGAGFGVLSALGFGGFLVGIDAASEGGVEWALLAARSTTLTVVAITVLAIRPQPRAARGDIPAFVLIGLLTLSADVMFAAATTEGLLSVVAVLGSLFPVVTIALASIHLGERMRREQWIGALLCLVGVAAIVV